MNKGRDLPRPVRRTGMLIAGLLALAGLAGQAALAASPSTGSPGNNGTVKIHEGAGEPPPNYPNQPHVCTFHLHFFFADPEQAGTWAIQEWAPSDKGKVVLTGTYDTADDGEDRQPEQGVYELPDGHYRLFWNGDLGTGKHDKMKVFWVDCETQGGVTRSAPPSKAVGSPVESQSAAPGTGESASPTETESAPPQGDTNGASPGGDDLAAAGAVDALTPPPTDTTAADAVGRQTNWPIALLIIAAMMAMAALLMPARRRDRLSR